MSELRPGAAFDELGVRLSRRFPEKYHPQRYTYIAHGDGLSDEYPALLFDDQYGGEVESGMVFSVEAYVGGKERTKESSSKSKSSLPNRESSC